MKQTSIQVKGHSMSRLLLTTTSALLIFSACNKTVDTPASNKPSAFSGEVIEKWMDLQVRLMRNATGIPNQAFSRPYVYAGIASLEALSPALPPGLRPARKWNGLTGLPVAKPSAHYSWPVNVNAALASINRSMFPNANQTDKMAIDSLESAVNADYLGTENPSVLDASRQFGKAVAAAVFNWSESDGYKLASASYTPPTGPGLWVPTAPAFAAAASPYWGNNRPVAEGSTDNTGVPHPQAFSTDPNSGFYQMVKEVYDASQKLTDAQKAMAVYWRDVPGVTSPGHWLNILLQTIRQTHTRLDKAAFAYAMTGAAINDGLIACWKSKYQYNLIRPISFIRGTMGYGSWTSHLTTPGHPEYPSAHAVLSIAAAEVFEKIFGSGHAFVDHTYDYLGMPSRSYSSFMAIGEEASHSRFYAGIHYKPSIQAGMEQGRKLAGNLFSSITPGKGH
jgi:hypothetical protein